MGNLKRLSYVVSLALTLAIASCTNNQYEEDSSLYKKEVPSGPMTDEMEIHGSEGDDHTNDDNDRKT